MWSIPRKKGSSANSGEVATSCCRVAAMDCGDLAPPCRSAWPDPPTRGLTQPTRGLMTSPSDRLAVLPAVLPALPTVWPSSPPSSRPSGQPKLSRGRTWESTSQVVRAVGFGSMRRPRRGTVGSVPRRPDRESPACPSGFADCRRARQGLGGNGTGNPCVSLPYSSARALSIAARRACISARRLRSASTTAAGALATNFSLPSLPEAAATPRATVA